MNHGFVKLAVLGPLAATFLCWQTELGSLLMGIAGRTPDSPKFTTSCLHDLNERRQRVGSVPLTTDSAIQSSLDGFLASVTNGSDIDLDFLLRHLQQTYPNVTALSATVVWHPTAAGLADGIGGWEDGVRREFETLSTVAFRDGYRRGCIGVLAHRLPLFELTSANREGGRFHHACPRCGAGHAIELERSARTVQLRCPHCQRPYDILASDSLGQFRRAPAFLNGFSMPDQPAIENDSASARLSAIWQFITARCRYIADGDDKVSDFASAAGRQGQESVAEAWQLPSETWLRKAGDCEDTSLLLADVLISEGFDARVALGWNAKGGDHAWCVVRLDDGAQYILESTIAPQGPLRLLPVSEASASYRPEQLFDRGHLYFPVSGGPATDYWSHDIWASVDVAPPAHHTAQR